MPPQKRECSLSAFLRAFYIFSFPRWRIVRYRGIFYIASVPSVAIFKNRYGGSEQWQQSDTLLQTAYGRSGSHGRIQARVRIFTRAGTGSALERNETERACGTSLRKEFIFGQIQRGRLRFAGSRPGSARKAYSKRGAPRILPKNSFLSFRKATASIYLVSSQRLQKSADCRCVTYR